MTVMPNTYQEFHLEISDYHFHNFLWYPLFNEVEETKISLIKFRKYERA